LLLADERLALANQRDRQGNATATQTAVPAQE